MLNAYNQIYNSGFSYDASGDMTSDGTYSYTWNAEGVRQKSWRSKRSAGVSPAVAGASRSRARAGCPGYAVLQPTMHCSLPRAGRMPTPQRARRPRYF